MDKYICQCCGGKINPISLVCEYCGTQYKQEWDNIIKIETFQNPVKTIATRIHVSPDELINFAKDENFTKYLAQRLQRQIAEGISPFIKCEIEENYIAGGINISGYMRGVIPKHTEKIDTIKEWRRLWR